MALFGFHLVLTLIAAAIFNKSAQCRSLCHYLFFKGLTYFVLESSVLSESNAHESDANSKRKRKKEKEFRESGDKDRLIQLPLSCDALHRVPFFESLILVANYSFFSIFVYLTSDLFCLLFPENKAINTSSIWIVGALFLQIHILAKISLQKIAIKELFSTERNTLLCVSALFFLFAITFCAFSEKIVDLNFARGYTEFVVSLDDYLFANGFGHMFASNSTNANFRSPIMCMVSISLLYSLVASAMFFPILQYASLYIHSDDCGTAFRFLLHVAFFSPLAIVLLYLRPIVDHLTENDFLTYAQLRMLRFILIGLWAILRLATAKVHLQTFLNQPRNKILEYRREKEEICRAKIASFASYSCVTSLQYILPVLITLSTTLLLKNFDRFDRGDSGHQNIIKIILSNELQEPLWSLSQIILLSTQFFVGLVGVIGERSF